APAQQPPGPPEPPTTAWYLKPAALLGWGALSAILIAVLVWGIMRLHSGDSGHTAATTTSSTSTTATTTPSTVAAPAPATTPPSTVAAPAPATTPPSTVATTTDPSTTAATTPGEAFQLPQLPSDITIPGLPPIQIPPGL
ncbi:MAG: hypothetical protein ACRDTN_04595, partial [Mycobacterium sp.]